MDFRILTFLASLTLLGFTKGEDLSFCNTVDFKHATDNCTDGKKYLLLGNCTSYYKCDGLANGVLLHEALSDCKEGQFFDRQKMDCVVGTAEQSSNCDQIKCESFFQSEGLGELGEQTPNTNSRYTSPGGQGGQTYGQGQNQGQHTPGQYNPSQQQPGQYPPGQYTPGKDQPGQYTPGKDQPGQYPNSPTHRPGYSSDNDDNYGEGGTSHGGHDAGVGDKDKGQNDKNKPKDEQKDAAHKGQQKNGSIIPTAAISVLLSIIFITSVQNI